MGSIYGMGFAFGISGSGGSGWVQTYTSSDNLAYGNGSNGNDGFVPDASNTANPWFSILGPVIATPWAAQLQNTGNLH
jgi:hypothetical protein